MIMKGATGEISHQFATLLSLKEDIHRKFAEKGQRREWDGYEKKEKLIWGLKIYIQIKKKTCSLFSLIS